MNANHHEVGSTDAHNVLTDSSFGDFLRSVQIVGLNPLKRLQLAEHPKVRHGLTRSPEVNVLRCGEAPFLTLA
jgi:hypothetical protein